MGCVNETNAAKPAKGEMILFTCRSLYVTGEGIRFVATYLPSEGKSLPDEFLYAELVGPNGRSYSSAKYQFINNFSSGVIRIPEDITTGYYYVRVYTRSMRNDGPSVYSYLRIKIVNPFLEDYLEGNVADSGAEACCISPGLFEPECVRNHLTDSHGSITTCRQGFNAAEQDTIACLFVSVVPVNTSSPPVRYHPILNQSFKTHFYAPDIRGFSLSGVVTRANLPYPGCRIYLSLNCPDKDILATNSDSLGRFRLAFPADVFCGDLYVAAQCHENKEIKLEIDREFCQIPYTLPDPPFLLSPDERDAALFLSLNRQVAKHFQEMVPVEDDRPTRNSQAAFYGEPSFVMRLDDFVDLPELVEYFNELPSQARVRNVNEKKVLRVLDDNSGFSYLEPLILLDFLPVFDVEQILSIPPESIDRIEIVNKPYTKGEMIFGGIISLITKRKDFAGYDFPRSGLFLNFSLPEEENQGIYTEAFDLGIPDTRNVFYWGIHPVRNGLDEVLFSFPTPRLPAGIQVRVAAITFNGQMLYGDCIIEQ
jgi:hypothetical protein